MKQKHSRFTRFAVGDFVRVKSNSWMPISIPSAVRRARIGKVKMLLHGGASIAFPGYPSQIDYMNEELQRCNSYIASGQPLPVRKSRI